MVRSSGFMLELDWRRQFCMISSVVNNLIYLCNLHLLVVSKAGKTTSKSAPAQAKQKRMESDEDFIVNDDDDRDKPLKLKGKGKTATPKKRTSTDMWDSDEEITPAKHKKTKQVSSESDDEGMPLRPAKNKEVVKPSKPVLSDESSGSEEDMKPAASKVHNTSV